MDDVRVLVVDDQEAFRSAMEGVVEVTDGLVLVGSVATGEDALSVVDVLRPGLVLLDVHLPGLDGVEVARRLRTLEGSVEGTPVVVLLSICDEVELDLGGCGSCGSGPTPAADTAPLCAGLLSGPSSPPPSCAASAAASRTRSSPGSRPGHVTRSRPASPGPAAAPPRW